MPELLFVALGVIVLLAVGFAIWEERKRDRRTRERIERKYKTY